MKIRVYDRFANSYHLAVKDRPQLDALLGNRFLELYYDEAQNKPVILAMDAIWKVEVVPPPEVNGNLTFPASLRAAFDYEGSYFKLEADALATGTLMSQAGIACDVVSGTEKLYRIKINGMRGVFRPKTSLDADWVAEAFRSL